MLLIHLGRDDWNTVGKFIHVMCYELCMNRKEKKNKRGQVFLVVLFDDDDDDDYDDGWWFAEMWKEKPSSSILKN